MKKIEVKKEVKDTIVPEKKVILTAEQQRISSLVDSSPTEFPEVKITDYLRRVEMEIPKIVKKPEFAYRWIWEKNLDKELTTVGGIFEIVSRSNHSHIPDRLFDIRGAISYKGENILCFTRRSISDEISNYNINEFNKKTERSIDATKEYSGGKIMIEQTDGATGGRNEVLMDEDGHYDAGSPS